MVHSQNTNATLLPMLTICIFIYIMQRLYHVFESTTEKAQLNRKQKVRFS